MNEHGHCNNCSCHWTDHINSFQYYVPCTIEEVVEVSALRAQFDEGKKNLTNSQLLLCKALDDLMKAIDGLEQAQKVIKKSGEFLQENAARKKAYLSTDYFKE